MFERNSGFFTFIWNNLLQPFQKDRIWTLFNPESDPYGAGWNIIQSKIAVGSGGLFGKGYGQGSQTQLNFLPETQTDFIFSVLAEEFGFIGVLLLVMIYAFVLLRCFYLAVNARDRFCRLVIGGFIFTFCFNVFVNLAMVVGLIPVVGMPLPFFSRGGTSLLSLFIMFWNNNFNGLPQEVYAKMIRIFFLSFFFAANTFSYVDKGETFEYLKSELILNHGFSEDYVVSTLNKAIKQDKIIQSISEPAEFTWTWDRYKDLFIEEKRIQNGKNLFLKILKHLKKQKVDLVSQKKLLHLSLG